MNITKASYELWGQYIASTTRQCKFNCYIYQYYFLQCGSSWIFDTITISLLYTFFEWYLVCTQLCLGHSLSMYLASSNICATYCVICHCICCCTCCYQCRKKKKILLTARHLQKSYHSSSHVLVTYISMYFLVIMLIIKCKCYHFFDILIHCYANTN